LQIKNLETSTIRIPIFFAGTVLSCRAFVQPVASKSSIRVAMASSNTSFWDKPAAQAHYLDNKQKSQSPGLSGIYKQAVEVTPLLKCFASLHAVQLLQKK
jgi:hypothetical protein